MPRSGELEVLKLIGNKVNAQILTLLRRQPMSPRDISRYLNKKEGDVVRRLKAMEKHSLVQGSWGSRLGQNVKLYSLTTRDVSVSLKQDGPKVTYGKRDRAEAKTAEIEPSDGFAGEAEIIGRNDELELLRESAGASFFFVVGIAGMGKTSLATKLAQESGTDKVLWHTFKEIDTFAYVVGRIALFLAKHGSNDLLKQLDSSSGPLEDEPQKLEMMIKSLKGLGECLLIFDDYHKVRDEKITVLLRYMEAKLGHPGKVVVLSRSKPPFFLDSVKSREIALSGLPLNDTKDMISRLGGTVDESTLRGVWKRFAGHPMALKIFCMLAQEKKPPGNLSLDRLVAYFRSEVLELLGREELDILVSLSVFRSPVRIQALRRAEHSRRSLNYLLHSLEKKMLLGRTGNQGFFVHDMLRDALYSLLAYPEEAHKSAALYYLAENTAEGTVEALYHLVKSDDIKGIASILEDEVLNERHRFLEEGYATPLLEILGQTNMSDFAGSRHWLVYLYSVEGKALAMLERWQEAMERLEQGLSIARETGDPLLVAHSQRTLGEALYLKGDFEPVEKHLLDAAAVFREHRMEDQIKKTCMKLARMYFATGRPEESQRYSEMAKSPGS